MLPHSFDLKMPFCVLCGRWLAPCHRIVWLAYVARIDEVEPEHLEPETLACWPCWEDILVLRLIPQPAGPLIQLLQQHE